MTVHQAWCAVAELAASQHGAFNRSQAADRGLNARHLRRGVQIGRVRQPLSDVFALAGSPRTWHQRLSVLSLAGATVAGRSAAALHRLDGFTPGRLEVVFDRRSHRKLPHAVIVHRWRDFGLDDTETCGEIRVTTIPRTLVDLAQVMPLARVEQALDAALRRGCSIAEINETIHRLWRPGRTGLAPLRRLLSDPDRAGVVPDSLFERLVEQVLVDAGLPTPIRQFDLRAGGGTRRVDLAWPAHRVAVEAHSKRWHFGAQAGGADNRRDLELAAEGWEVVYVTWKMAHDPASFVGTLRRILDRRSPHGATGS